MTREAEWVRLEMDDPDTVARAVSGSDMAIYLVPGDEAAPDRSVQRAEAFLEAADRAHVQRLVYLGTMAPQGPPSRHTACHLATGRALRAGRLATVELRTAMILGAGGASWRMMSDLAARLPAMVLPRWVHNRSWPVAIDDVIRAMLTALNLPDADVGCYDVPGPESLSHQLVLERVAAQLGARPPMWSVPLTVPWLSSYWVAFVTRVGLAEARRLVAGLESHVVPTCRLIWEHVPRHRGMSLEEATVNALMDERAKAVPSRRALAAMQALGRAHGRHPMPAA